MSEAIDMADAKTALLEGYYGRIADGALRCMPMSNPAPGVKAIGMQAYQGEWLSVLTTPWFMNLVLMQGDTLVTAAQVGAKSRVALPGGMIEFIQSDGEDLGPHRMCSLYSPVFEFKTMDDAILTANAIIEQLMEAPKAETDDGMLAIWEGRLDEAEAKAATEQRQAGQEEKEPFADAKVSRRALFGLSSKDGAEVAP